MFTLPSLDYEYNELEPHIDAKTMEIHHNKHHQGYVDKLNLAVQGTEREDKPLEEILQSLPLLPSEIQTAVKNNGGGHWNHSFFWKIMTPGGKAMSDNMANLINENFGSVDKMKEQFANSAVSNFGSGWTWIIANNYGELEIVNTPNQDNPIMKHQKAILGIDLREHAYYLKHQNKRADYINDWRNVVNWEMVEDMTNGK